MSYGATKGEKKICMSARPSALRTPYNECTYILPTTIVVLHVRCARRGGIFLRLTAIPDMTQTRPSHEPSPSLVHLGPGQPCAINTQHLPPPQQAQPQQGSSRQLPTCVVDPHIHMDDERLWQTCFAILFRHLVCLLVHARCSTAYLVPRMDAQHAWAWSTIGIER